MLSDLAIRNIRDALLHGKLVPLLGAGISYDGPASMPVADELVRPLKSALNDAVAFSFSKSILTSDEVKMCKHLIDQAPLESLLTALQSTYRESALSYLSHALPSNEINSNHEGLARLATSFELPHIITLNFDVLIEKALDCEGVLHKTSCTIHSLMAKNPPSRFHCEIVKPHGTLRHSKGTYSFENNLSTTLDVLGQEPNPQTRKRFEEIFSLHPVLVVAGYGGEDWDIFPLLQEAIKNGDLEKVYWFRYPNSDVNADVVDWCNQLARTGNGEMIEHDFTDLLARLLNNSSLTKKPKREDPRINAGQFDDVYKNSFAVVELLVIAGFANTARALLEWIWGQIPKGTSITWDYLISRKLGFVYHLVGDSRKYYELYQFALQKESYLPSTWRSTIAESKSWHVHACLSLLKPQRILKTKNPFRWGKLYWQAKKSRRVCAKLCEENSECSQPIELANHFFADFWLSWMNLFFVFGPAIHVFLRIPSRLLIYRLSKSSGNTAGFLSGGYWGLREMELRFLAGQIPITKDNRDLARLTTRLSFYRSTNSQVERGNAHAYKGLILGWLGDNEAEIEFNEAEEVWSKQEPPSKQGLARVVLFRRLLGKLTFRKAIGDLWRLYWGN